MVDLHKRSTLKLALAVTTGAVVVLPVTQSFAATKAYDDPINNTNTSAFGIAELLIRITRNSVVFTNLTNHAVAVKHFTPGSVQWQDNYIDLNTLRSTACLTLSPFATTRVPAQTVKRTLPNVTSIWADDAIVLQPDGAQSILLGAYSHQHLLHLFPIPAVNRTSRDSGILS